MGFKKDVGIKRSSEYESMDEPSEKKSKIDAQHESNLIEVSKDQGVIPVENGNECFINRLPVEILEIILGDSDFNKDTKKNLRLVCKLWQIVCNQRINERRIILPRLNTENDPNAYERIADFQFERFSLCFTSNNEVERLPLTIWEKIGVKIVSLDFYHCRIGDKLMKTIIRVCENLRFFRIQIESIQVDNLNVEFCTPKTLENLNVTRRSLETFEIAIAAYSLRDDLVEEWQAIFKAFLRIYPNVIHYNSTTIPLILHFTLSKQYHEADIDKIPSILALSYTKPHDNWQIILEKLSAVRLSSIMLRIHPLITTAFLQALRSTIFSFFTKQKGLESIVLSLGLQQEIRQLQKDLILLILENCTKLRHLDHTLMIDGPWVNNIEKSELKKLLTSSSTELWIRGFTTLLHPNPKCSSISISGPRECNSYKLYYRFCNNLNSEVLKLIPRISFLQHFNLEVSISDEALQTIFKYLTDLRILKLRLSSRNTNFGLFGRNDEGTTENTGYSINRLQNLEKLTLLADCWLGKPVVDAIFPEFHLPKLHYLYSFSPGNCFDFRIFGTNFPELRTINLSMCPGESLLLSEESILSLCEYSKNLHTIDMRRKEINILLKSARLIFASCPTLRYFYTSKKCYYYDPLTKILKFKNIK